MDRPGTALELGTVGVLAVHNLLVNHVVPTPLDDVLNVLAATGLTVGARRNGVEWNELGMSRQALPRGIAVGSAAAVVAVAAVTAAASFPATRRFFHDERVAGTHRLDALYHSMVRIPVATAVAEEVLFRGVLDVALSRRRSPVVAGTTASVLFGLWHVLPTLRTVEGNPVRKITRGDGRLTAVAGAVAATSLAGAGFRWLRHTSGSLAAPVMAHAAVNVAAYLIGRSVASRSTPYQSPG
jgi:uncharacterized protein